MGPAGLPSGRWRDGLATGAADARADGGAAPRGRAAAPGQEAVAGRDRPRGGGQPGLGDALEAAAGWRRPASAAAAPGARAGVAVDGGPVAPTGPGAGPRGRGGRGRARAVA